MTSVGNPMIDQCPIVDRCTPNPCFHGGICFQSWFDFVCDCSLTNYNNDRVGFSFKYKHNSAHNSPHTSAILAILPWTFIGRYLEDFRRDVYLF